MNRTYEPTEDRRGLYATLALIAALTALTALLLAAVPGPPVGSLYAVGVLGGNPEDTAAPTDEEEEEQEEAAAVEAAVENFSRSYNYSGSDGDQLLAQIAPHVNESFWASPRGSQNASDAAAIETYVLQQTELLAWEPVEVGSEEATGYVTRSFHTESTAGMQKYRLRHELRLVKESGTWKVSWAGEDVGQEG